MEVLIVLEEELLGGAKKVKAFSHDNPFAGVMGV